MWDAYDKIIHLRYRGYNDLVNAYDAGRKIDAMAAVLGYWSELIVKGKPSEFPKQLHRIFRDLVSTIQLARTRIISFKWVSNQRFLQNFENSILVSFEELDTEKQQKITHKCNVCKKHDINKLYKVTLYGWNSLSRDGNGLFPKSMNADTMLNNPDIIQKSYKTFKRKYQTLNETLDESHWFKEEYIVGSECYKYIRHLWTCRICLIETLWEIDYEKDKRNLPRSIIDHNSNSIKDRERWMDKTHRWIK